MALMSSRLRRRYRLRSRCWWVELRQDRLEAPHARRQREAVALDRLAQQVGEGRLVVVSKIRRHCRIMRRNRSEGESAPMTLGQALTAQVRLIVWCKSCWHRAEPLISCKASSPPLSYS